MKTITSAEFRRDYAVLTEPVVVTANRRTLGTWTPGVALTLEGTWSPESVAALLEAKDEEIARLKRELAKREPEGRRSVSQAALVDYARRTGARGVPEVDAAIERGERGTPGRFLSDAVATTRRDRQKVIDEALRKVQKGKKP